MARLPAPTGNIDQAYMRMLVGNLNTQLHNLEQAVQALSNEPAKVSPGVVGGNVVESVWRLAAGAQLPGNIVISGGSVWISRYDAYARDIGLYFSNKNQLTLQMRDDPNAYARYTITGVVATPDAVTLTTTLVTGSIAPPGAVYVRGEV